MSPNYLIKKLSTDKRDLQQKMDDMTYPSPISVSITRDDSE